ncbi:MAG: sugar transferase [Rhodobacterales bacterium]|nr:MAG: sugar transferase [Rhodobacterales bacterium]
MSWLYVNITKPVVDVIVAIALLVLFSPLMLAVIIRAFVKNDRPIFYIAERMIDLNKSFMLIKFRTMRAPEPGECNAGVSGGNKAHRVTEFGKFLRRYRLDEGPQLVNIITGSISFVGPRPPLRRYTEKYPEIYGQILKNRPGLTGLATIIYHNHETRLLERAKTAEETEQIYVRRCIPRKARLDLIYQRNISLRLDLYIVYLTAAKIFPLPGRRVRRLRRHSGAGL